MKRSKLKLLILCVISILIIELFQIKNTFSIDGTLVETIDTDTEVFVNDRRKAGDIEDSTISSEIFPVLELSTNTENISIREITAYNAGDPYQCDNTPCISASGDDICMLLTQGINICAANWVPFGTILEIKELGECVVLDRMNSRTPERIDWAMRAHEKTKAINFGLRHLAVKIIK